jgi:hypothetical protein
MAFLASAIRLAKSAYDTAYKVAKNAVEFTNKKVTMHSSPGLSVTMSIDGLDNMYAISSALWKVTSKTGGGLSDAIATQVADDMLDEIVISLLPIRRTGQLEESFRIVQNGSRIEIVSDERYAATILGEARSWGKPPIENIQEWMGTVSNFDIGDADPRQIAGAIFASWDPNETDASPRSALYSLNPVGQKSFDYVGEALVNVASRVDNEALRVVREVVNT